MTAPYWDAEREAWIDEDGRERHCQSCHDDHDYWGFPFDEFYVYLSWEEEEQGIDPPKPHRCCCCDQWHLLVRWAGGPGARMRDFVGQLDRWPKEAQARVRALFEELKEVKEVKAKG